MYKVLLTTALSSLLLCSCSNDDENSPVPVNTPKEAPQPDDSNEDQSGLASEVAGGGSGGAQADEPAEAPVQDLEATRFADYLSSNESIVTKNLAGEVLEMASGFKGKGSADDAEADEDGYVPGASLELLLNEDFTYELRVKDILLKRENTISWMKAPTPARIVRGEWTTDKKDGLILSGVASGELKLAEKPTQKDEMVLRFDESIEDNDMAKFAGIAVVTNFGSVDVDSSDSKSSQASHIQPLAKAATGITYDASQIEEIPQQVVIKPNVEAKKVVLEKGKKSPGSAATGITYGSGTNF